MRYAVGWTLGIMVFVLGIGWIAEGNDFFMFKFFAPKRAAVERQVFEETKSYNDGMAQELSAMEIDYAKADPGQKAALRSVILHRYASYDTDRLPLDLRGFLSTVQHDALVTQ